MNGYNIPAQPVTENGHTFDSILERDWAGFVTHMGLTWKRQRIDIRGSEQRNAPVIAQPDFVLPQMSAILECKPTRELVLAHESKWYAEAEAFGGPVIVTDSSPKPQKIAFDDALAPLLCRWALVPPTLHLFMPGAARIELNIVECPDCLMLGFVGGGPQLATEENTLRVVGAMLGLNAEPPGEWYWLSACRHRPRWTLGAQATAARRVFPRLRGDDWHAPYTWQVAS